MVVDDKSGGWSSASPADLEEYVNRVDSMRGYFNSACERAEALWLEELPRNDFVDFASPFGDAENMMTTWKNRTEFVSDVRQAFIDADSYDPNEPEAVITVPTSEVTATVGRSAEALEALGVSPEDAEKIAAGSPELFDAVINGRISVDAALEVAELTPTEQRNALSTDLDSDEIVEVLDGNHGDDAKTALIEGHGYRVRLLMLDDEARSAILAGDALAIVLGDDKHVSFEELNKRVQGGREEIVAAYEEDGLSPEEANAAYDDLVASLDYLGENDDARDALDGSADDDSKPGDPDADNKFSIKDAQTRAIELLEDNEDSNSQRLWQTALQGQLGSLPITVIVLPEDEAAARRLIDESTHHVSVSPRSSGTSGDRLNIDQVVAEIQALRRTDPEAAAALELAVARELEGETRDAFVEKMNQANVYEDTANGVIASQIERDVELDQEDIDSETDRILDHSDKEVGGRSTARKFDANEAEYQLNELAKEKPALALAVKQQLERQISPEDAAELNRLMADSGFFDDIDSAGNHPAQAAEGAAKGFVNGFAFIGNVVLDDNVWDGIDGPIPYFELENSAQRGGANLGAIAELALAGKGIIKIGGKWFIRNGDELVEVTVKNTPANKKATDLTELNAKKGTAPQPGRMDEVLNKARPQTVDDIVAQIPPNATMRKLAPSSQGGSQVGVEYKWTDANGKTNRVRIHDPDPSAPSGSNSAEGWTVRWQKGQRYYDPETGQFAPRNAHNPNSPNYDMDAANNTHIPVEPPDPTITNSMR